MIENRPLKLNIFSKRVLILISAILSLFILNLGFSNYHLNEILNSVEKTESIMEDFNARLRLTKTDKYNCFRSENVGRVYCGDGVNDWVKNTVKKNAYQSRIDLEVETFKLNQIKLFIFGNEFKTTLLKYTDHANSWLDYYKRVEGCSDYACYDSEISKPNNISTTFGVAEVEFRSVIPSIDLLDSRSRIEAVFENSTDLSNKKIAGKFDSAPNNWMSKYLEKWNLLG